MQTCLCRCAARQQQPKYGAQGRQERPSWGALTRPPSQAGKEREAGGGRPAGPLTALWSRPTQDPLPAKPGLMPSSCAATPVPLPSFGLCQGSSHSAFTGHQTLPSGQLASCPPFTKKGGAQLVGIILEGSRCLTAPPCVNLVSLYLYPTSQARCCRAAGPTGLSSGPTVSNHSSLAVMSKFSSSAKI